MAALQEKEILWPQQREEPGVEYYEDQKGHRRGGEEEDDINIDIHTGHGGATIRYLPLHHVYSATSPVMSKKIKAQKQQQTSVASDQKPSFVHVYSRRHSTKPNSSFYDRITSCSQPIKIDQRDHEVDGLCVKSEWKRKRIGSSELVKPGVGSEDVLRNLRITRFREARAKDNNSDVNGKDDSCTNNVVNSRKRKHNCTENLHEAGAKKWAWLCFDGVDPKTFIRLKCKVYWPLDDDWYAGSVVGYDPESRRHHVKYDDGDEEHLFLRNERVKFCVSHEDMQRLNLNYGVKSMDSYGIDYGEMVVLAASLEYSQELEPGDIVWAKLTGHAMWPAVLVNQTSITSRKGTNKDSGCKSVPVQFFGTYDFARVNTKQVISFLRGLLSSFHLKCKKSHFARSLEEAKMYLSRQKLPKRMLRLQNGMDADICDSGEDEQSIDSNEDCEGNEKKNELEEGINCFPFKFGDLQVINLGKIVKDSDYFRDEKFFWPEGYTAVRKFTSVTDPSMCTLYKMEVLRDADLKFRPLFRVTSDNGEQFKGPTPSACWNKIYRRIRKTLNDTSNGYGVEGQPGSMFKSGSYMFGFPNPKISKLIQELSSPKLTSHFSACKRTKTYQDAPAGYRPVRVDWKDLDKCSVCHTDEEYENNLFLQCEKCRMMVHARCYGELEPVDGVLWLCNLCRSGAPVPPPPCCLCPVIAGAMKPTTDGRWAHLACAIWIPETCLSDIKRMEPIDGLSRIHKDRWKLLCSICGVSYGACIQCSDSTCRVAYHPLCARAAGLCIELEDEDRLHLASMDEDDPEGSIRLLSFCKKHRRPSNEHLAAEERIGQVTHQCSDYTPPSNPSGCARTEPYNSFGRRGRKEPEAIAAASSKRLFVENQPYLVCGYCHHESAGSKYSFTMQKLKNLQLNGPKGILSVAEKYRHMKDTFRRRLTFGKSRIHGFGIFAKHPHKAGDMVIEYTGELVRPSIADRRERLIYNSLVGAGTYMFRIDDARVIDATRMGSVAHLINHSCEPNCYSRVISVNGDEHIIIFAKRDIRQWEELTYDYRFFSIDEQLACYCDFPRCRGVVNDVEAQEAMANLYAPRSELIDWRRQ